MTRSTKVTSNLYRWADLPKLAGLSLLYIFLVHWTSGNLSIKGSVSVFWLPSGLALAGLLMGGIKYWPAVFVGTLASVSSEGYPLWHQLGLASANSMEALIAAWLLLRSDRFDVALMHAEDYLRMFLAGSAGACAGALTGVGTLLLAGRVAPPAFAGSLLHWYQGDILSILLLTPLILVWRQLPSGWFIRTRVLETIACFGLAALLGQITFVGWAQSLFGRPPLGHLAFFFVTWGAVRFGRHGALLLVVMAALQALVGAVLGVGFFASDPAQFDLNNLWMFLVALTIVGITVALLFNERILSEQSLRQAEENLRLLTANLHEMVLAYDMNRKLVYANPAVEKLTGYSVAYLRREQYVCWVDPEDRARMLGHWEGLFHGKAFAEEEYRLVTKDGRRRWASASWGPMLDDTGHQVGVQGSERDISDRKTAEVALRESEERHRAILQTAMDGFWRVDLQGRLLEVNETICGMTGYSTQELLGMRLSDLVAGQTADERAAESRKIVAQGEDRFESRIYRKDGSVFDVEVSVQYRPIEGGWFVAFLRDVTERKRAEAERAQLEQQFHQAQKMESVGRLAGGVAHDFNNLLTVINGYSQMLLANLSAGDPLRDSLAEIHKAGERAAGLTRQLLAFSRKQVLATAPVGCQPGGGGDAADARAAGGGRRRGACRAPRGGRDDPRRSASVGAGGDEPGGQRARRHAERRQAAGRDGQRGVGRELYPVASGSARGALRHAGGERHRGGHGRRDEEADLRAVLHHQGSGQRDRARAVDGAGHRGAERRLRRGAQRRGEGDHFQDLPAGAGRSGKPMLGGRLRFRRWGERKPCWWWRTRRRSASTLSRC